MMGYHDCPLTVTTGETFVLERKSEYSENQRRGEIFCVINNLRRKAWKEAGSLAFCRSRYFQETLSNESVSVHVDFRGLSKGRCPRITGLNRSDFSKRVFNPLSIKFFVISTHLGEKR